MKKHHQFKVGDLVYAPPGFKTIEWKDYALTGGAVFQITNKKNNFSYIRGKGHTGQERISEMSYPDFVFKKVPEDELWF